MWWPSTWHASRRGGRPVRRQGSGEGDGLPDRATPEPRPVSHIPGSSGPRPWSTTTTSTGVDRDFGPFFLKFCSYFPYNAKLCLNGHEYLKRQLAQGGSLTRRSTTAFCPVRPPGSCRRLPMGCRRRRSRPCCGSGWRACRIPLRPAIATPATATSSRSCRPSSP